jgi:Flp pilus assembly protein CpaB
MTMSYRLRNLLIALVFAIVAVGITIAYASSTKASSRATQTDTRVLVAARDIPTGTPASLLVRAGYAKLVAVPRSALVPDALSTVSNVRDLSVSQQINAGEQVTARRLSASAAHGVQTQLAGRLRAVELSGDENQVLAGSLIAGEHVDVLASLSYPEGSSTHFTRVVASDLLVLDTSSKGTSKLTSGSSASSVLLAMTDVQAERVFHVVTHDDWTLMLRPVSRPKNTPANVVSSETILRQGVQP